MKKEQIYSMLHYLDKNCRRKRRTVLERKKHFSKMIIENFHLLSEPAKTKVVFENNLIFKNWLQKAKLYKKHGFLKNFYFNSTDFLGDDFFKKKSHLLQLSKNKLLLSSFAYGKIISQKNYDKLLEIYLENHKPLKEDLNAFLNFYLFQADDLDKVVKFSEIFYPEDLKSRKVFILDLFYAFVSDLDRIIFSEETLEKFDELEIKIDASYLLRHFFLKKK